MLERKPWKRPRKGRKIPREKTDRDQTEPLLLSPHLFHIEVISSVDSSQSARAQIYKVERYNQAKTVKIHFYYESSSAAETLGALQL
jgi:hypothetical protein